MELKPIKITASQRKHGNAKAGKELIHNYFFNHGKCAFHPFSATPLVATSEKMSDTRERLAGAHHFPLHSPVVAVFIILFLLCRSRYFHFFAAIALLSIISLPAHLI